MLLALALIAHLYTITAPSPVGVRMTGNLTLPLDHLVDI
jgi:hypothetical protein